MSILIPGARPPFVVPYCRLCDLPVERFTVLPVKSAYYVELEAQCCGRTQGIRMSVDELMRAKRGGEKIYAVAKVGHYQGFGELRRAHA